MRNAILMSLRRVALLLRRSAAYNRRQHASKLAMVLAVPVVGALLEGVVEYFRETGEANTGFDGLALFLALAYGLYLTSMLFRELDSAKQGWMYLTLPAGPGEKIAAAWIESMVVYPLVFTAAIWLSSLLGASLLEWLFGNSYVPFNPFRAEYLRMLGLYIVAQHLYFFGAITFRNSHFTKTTLMILAALTALGVWLVSLVLCAQLFYDFRDFSTHGFDVTWMDAGGRAGWFFATHAVPALCVVVSYFKLREREV